MATGRQIRAARGLLEWSAADLARAAGVQRATISNMEAETHAPNPATISAVMGVFDLNGIEFLPNEGVAVRKSEIRSFNGKAGYRELLDHIYETMKNGGRIRQFNFGDGKYLAYAEDYIEFHLDRMAKIKNLDARVLTLASEANLEAKYCEYRWLDKSCKTFAPYYVYGDFVVLSIHEATFKKELVSISTKLIAERYVQQFDTIWAKSVTPKKKR